MTATHVAIVLAAGGSRRLGFPKQQLTRDGETLLRRAVRLAAQTQPRRLLVVLGAGHVRLASELDDIAHEFVINDDWCEGLASSLRIAAMHLAEASLPALILGCDQPALMAEHLSQLLALAATASSGCAAANYSDRLGVPAVVSPDMLKHSATLRGDHGLGKRLNALPANAVGRLLAPELALDIDTVDDLRQALGAGLVDSPGR